MKQKKPVSKTKSESEFQLMVQPEEGIDPVLKAIHRARKSVDLLIFRFDRAEIEEALIKAVERGVVVQALIASTNRGGEQNLRRLETRLLAAGVTVSRTADDLARYHGKMMIIDRKELFVMGFNLTALDIKKSRSFAVVTTSRRFVAEASKLFEADSNRKPFKTGLKTFLVSPLNARTELAEFLEGAKKEIAIYDPCLGDPQMVRILEERSRAGVTVRVIGTIKRPTNILKGFPLSQMRLHTRTIVRDGREVFVGSQSLRPAELDGRREIGLIVSERKVVKGILKIFEEDWKLAEGKKGKEPEQHLAGDKLAKKVAKAITEELPTVGDVIESVARDGGKNLDLGGVDMDSLQESVRDAVKTVVKETIQDAAGSGS